MDWCLNETAANGEKAAEEYCGPPYPLWTSLVLLVSLVYHFFEIMKTMCFILMLVLIMMVQQGESFTGTVCPRRTLKGCPKGYQVTCCDSSECKNGEFCCFVNENCEIKCMKPVVNGPEGPFSEDRDTCMAYKKPRKI
ncbi:unnamed protein product [Larinioides sclopetarius]|uniref:WAP domain-containing protein n=1 Tax=Larinioides sclopetarius TaxID=280406 RepID=A0AAV2AR31_9ARAC